MNTTQMSELKQILSSARQQIHKPTRGSKAEALEKLDYCISILFREMCKYRKEITHVHVVALDGKKAWFVRVNNDVKQEFLFSHYPDEWDMDVKEIVGLSPEEALEVARKKHREFIAREC